MNVHTFGIPAYIKDSIAYGTEMELKEVVVHTYGTDELDVICKANRVFKGLTFENPMEGKSFCSYAMIHKIGLSKRQEYEILQITCKSDRLLFIRAHLLATIAVFKRGKLHQRNYRDERPFQKL